MLELRSRWNALSWLQRTVLLLVTSFPLVSVAVKDGGSILYSITAFFALFYAWSECKQLTVAEKRWLLAYVALFIIAAISLTYSVDIELGVKRLDRFLRIASLGVIFLLLKQMKLELGPFFIVGVLLASVFLGIEAWYEVHVLQQQLVHGVYHKIVFGDMAVLNTAILLAAMLTVVNQPKYLLVLTVAMLAALYASLMSMTRGSWLFLLILAPVLVWLFRTKVPKHGWIVGVVGSIIAIGVFAVWQPPAVVNPVKAGMADIQRYMENPEDGGSWSSRLGMWRNSIRIWKENPILGTGIGDFQHDSRELVREGISVNRSATQYSHAHSIFFDALASMGMLGLILLIVALFILPWRLFHRYWCHVSEPWERFSALAGLTTVLAFAVFGLSEGWLARNPFVNTYVIYIAVLAAELSVRVQKQQRANIS